MAFWKPLVQRIYRQAEQGVSQSSNIGRLSTRNRRRGGYKTKIEALETRALLTSVTGDFNHDGIADVAIGMPTLSVNGVTNAGEVQILYGTVPNPTAQSGGAVDPGTTGLTAIGNQNFSQATPSLNGSVQAGNQFGSALAVGDFNGDGYADLAIGVSGQSVNGAAGAGAAYILFGGKNGLKATGAQLWTENTAGINGIATAGDHFGASLAVGDFNHDKKLDLAIGVSNKTVNGLANAGAVNIIFGHVGGLKASQDQLIDQSQLHAGSVGANDLFGSALATGDFNADGFTDLAVGSPGQTVGGNANAGAVNVIYGAHSGLLATGNQFWTAAANGVSGISNASAQFGFALAAGDFNDDSRIDLAIGAPGENVGSTSNAGAVHVLLGTSARLSATNNQLWNEGNTGVSGSALTAGDRFGASLAAGRMNNDRLYDLAIGAPGETVSSDAGAGQVTVLYGSNASSTQTVAGLGTTNAQTWDKSKLTSTGDSVAANEAFGSGLAIGDFNGDKFGDLVSEIPAESFNAPSQGATPLPGAASIIFGTNTGLNAGGTGTNEATQVWIPVQKQIFPDIKRQNIFSDPALAAKNLKDGNAFLAANKSKPGVITTADGLQYKIITSNPGGAQPTDSSQVTVDYTGTLINGTKFDSSADHGGSSTFSVGGVVPGFAEALKLMHVGDHITVYIPSNLGYGAQGQFPSVPPNSVLIFDLQLDSIS